ncbi:MAG: cupin domain-containing protein [Rhodobacter sp.]|nr:cupin domain-containing protein [Rhodobacter sp.]
MADTPLVLKAAQIAAAPFDFRHPLDDNAEIRLFALSRITGLSNTSVSLAHIAPGRCSYPKHRHHAADEWIYLLSGTATLDMDGEVHSLGPGDFAAFPAGGPAHKLTNTGSETLVYLMGGNRAALEVADFPEQGQRLTIGNSGPMPQAELSPLDAHAAFDYFSRDKDDA